MLTRLFSQSLPSPTEEQRQTMLYEKEIGLSSEIISAAYEPRFKLYALGSATGDLHVINENNCRYSFVPSSPEPPVLKLIPLTNSSSFLSVSSYSLYQNHVFNRPRQERPEEANNIFYKPKTILSEIKIEASKSHITHWIVAHDGKIAHRMHSVRYDIIDFAASQLHPEFILLLTKTGSIYGFSVEEMKFTDLYIDLFEGKNVHSIICPFDLKFFICHDTIEKLDISNKEVSKCAQINTVQIDILDENGNLIAAIESQKKIPQLFKGNRLQYSIENLNDSIGTCVSMINDKDWTSIVHSNDCDSIYFNNQPKISLDGEMIIPAISVEYQKPLTREGPKNVTFFTSTGRFLDLHGNSIDHFMVKPIDPKLAFIDKSDNIYIFNIKNQCFVFEKSNFSGSFTFDWGKPLAVLNGYALCIDENKELFVAGIKDNKKVELNSPLLPSKAVSYQVYESFIDFLCEDGKVIRFDLFNKEKFEGEEVVDSQELNAYSNYPSSDDVLYWRPFNGTFAIIKKQAQSRPLLAVDKFTSNEVCEKNEEVILFDVIDDSGKVTTKSASYILTVTTFHVSIFAIDKKGIKRIRHVSLSRDHIIEASITSWGVLIVRTCDSVEVLALPDVSFDPVCQMSLDYDAAPPLLPSENCISAPTSAPPSSEILNLKPPAESEDTLPVSVNPDKTKKKIIKLSAKKENKKAKSKDKNKNKNKNKDQDQNDSQENSENQDETQNAASTETTEKQEQQETNENITKTESTNDNDNVNDNVNDMLEYVKAVNPIILPHKGLIVFERNLVTIYLKNHQIEPCFDEENLPPALTPPPTTGFKKLFGKKNTISLEEADRCFLFNRSNLPQQTDHNHNQTENPASENKKDEATARASSIGGALAETQERMQQLLVMANERGEQLNELEIKAQRLLKSAKQYRKRIRQFHH